MSSYYLRCFGKPEILIDNHSVCFHRNKSLAIVIYLRLSGKPCPRERLTGIFWPGLDSKHARANLRTVLTECRSILGPDMVKAESDTVTIETESIQCDYEDFLRLSESQDIELLTHASQIYQDSLFNGFFLNDCPEYDDWQFAKAQQAFVLYAKVLERLFIGAVLSGDKESALKSVRNLVLIDPTNEDYQRSLIRLYADMGDYTSAMSQYETLKRVIQRDGSAEVEIETLKLVQKIKKYRKSKHLLSRGSSPVLVKPPIHKFIFIVPVILISLTAIFLFLFTNRTNIFAVEHPYSIAVLPFIFQCKEEDTERFAEVFTIDMTTALAEEEFFKVTPYATMRHYRDSQMTVAEISNEVEVEYILFGSAMKYQECIRFSVQLIDTENDQCIWAETYDCTIEHSVETQNEVVGYLRTCVKREMSNLLD